MNLVKKHSMIHKILCLVVVLVVLGIIVYEFLKHQKKFIQASYTACTVDQIQHLTLSENYLFKLLHLLKITDEILTTAGVRYVACGGTLLSMIRAGFLTPWDDDGDINLFKKDYEQKEEEINLLLLKHKVYLDKTFAIFDTLKLRFSDDNPLLEQYPSDDSPFIDWLMFGKQNNDEDMHYNYTSQVVRAIFPFEYILEEDLFPIRKMSLSATKNSNETIQLNVANNAATIINRAFGTKQDPEMWKSFHLASSHRDVSLLIRPCQLSEQHIGAFNYTKI